MRGKTLFYGKCIASRDTVTHDIAEYKCFDFVYPARDAARMESVVRRMAASFRL